MPLTILTQRQDNQSLYKYRNDVFEIQLKILHTFVPAD